MGWVPVHAVRGPARALEVRGHSEHWTFALLITVPLVIACLVAARRAVGPGRAMLLAAAVAVLLGVIAVQASVPIMSVGEPAVAVLLGAVVLGEHVGVRGPAAIVLVATVWAMLAAVVALARGQASEIAEPAVSQRYPSQTSADPPLATVGSQHPRS